MHNGIQRPRWSYVPGRAVDDMTYNREVLDRYLARYRPPRTAVLRRIGTIVARLLRMNRHRDRS